MGRRRVQRWGVAGDQWITNEKTLLTRAGLREVDEFIAAATPDPAVLGDGGVHHFGTCGPGHGVCGIYPDGEFVYWPFALVVAYVVIAAFYIRRSRAQGIETRVRPYAIVGIVIAVVLTAAVLWELNTPSANGPAGPHSLGWRLVTPASAIGLALLVLAQAERNRVLLVLTLAYLAAVLGPVDFGWVLAPLSRWYFLPRVVIDGSVLLLGGLGFALAQRPFRSPAP